MKRKILLLSLPLLIAADFILRSQMPVEHTRWQRYADWSYDSTKTSTVGLVPSDDASLARPAGLSSTLDYDQIASMVELALERAGGLERYIGPDDRKIVIKPNIVEATANEDGVNTDWRVVKALVLHLYRMNSDFQIRVAEGGAWAKPGTTYAPAWALSAYGYDVSGYHAMIDSLRASTQYPGLDVDWVDLNYDDTVRVAVPEPRLSDDQSVFFLPKTIVEADFIISAPVLKVHTPSITVGLKNYVGVLPGMVYGWSKDQGYHNNGIGLDHTAEHLSKNFIDVVRTAGCDFALVDGIVGKEISKFTSGRSIRRNLIVAGQDVVSVDAVCARLMDINPEDVEHVSLAALSGLGQNDLSKISVVGAVLEDNVRPHIKAQKSMSSQYMNSRYPYYGQSNRVWLLNGPYFGAAINQDVLPGGEAEAEPVAGENGWSEALYFFDDLIDPAAVYQDTADCIYYAFSYLLADQARSAQLWVGSDGNLKVWIGDQLAYDYESGVRVHRLPTRVVDVQIEAGYNPVLVKVKQTAGVSRFSLNICEPETDTNYAGNRLAGARFVTATVPERLNGDYDGDGRVNIMDLLGLLKVLNKPDKDPMYDFNGDGRVDIFDLIGMLQFISQSSRQL
ncbi:MAG TPA: DUF362 domain-containing protein [Candidatus Glassbacteria bacterium]|nr:DUF362 domain-containing protein [Candidatus Glassbacteria bacterium]